jgi:hypothetical protein
MPPSPARNFFVFTGPSLHPNEASTLVPAARILPPIKRGDLELIANLDADAVAIIDGEFFQNLAVSPKEILTFLERGVRVYGASSMGALRAVELARFGMIGVGAVFRLFRGGWMEDDDEVALTYCPWTYQHMSEPLVSTRFALRRAEKHGLLRGEERRNIISQLKSLYFPDRTAAALHHISVAALGAERAAALGTYLAHSGSDVKHDDACKLLSILSARDAA